MAFTFINYMCTLKVINWYGMALSYQICTWSGSCHTCSRAPCLMLLKIEAYSHRPSLLRDLRGCESGVQMVENEDNDVAALDNDVLFRLACVQSSL